jgi:hypothetical protein
VSVESINHIFRSLEKTFTSAIPSSSDGQHGRKSALSGAQHELSGEERPHTGPGTAGAGTSAIVRYWTVKFERGGRTHYDHVEACDVWKASMVAEKRNEGANGVQVVREIRSDEYEALTRKSP